MLSCRLATLLEHARHLVVALHLLQVKVAM